MFSHFAHVAAYYASIGDKARAEHFEKLSQGRLSYFSIAVPKVRSERK